MSIAKLSRTVPELSITGVFDGRLLGAGREEEAPVIWAVASGNGRGGFSVLDFDVLLVLPVGFSAFSFIFCGVHYIEKGVEFINKK